MKDEPRRLERQDLLRAHRDSLRLVHASRRPERLRRRADVEDVCADAVALTVRVALDRPAALAASAENARRYAVAAGGANDSPGCERGDEERSQQPWGEERPCVHGTLPEP